jgi:hypothetical protein
MVGRFGSVVISLRRERFTPDDEGKNRAGELLKTQVSSRKRRKNVRESKRPSSLPPQLPL